MLGYSVLPALYIVCLLGVAARVFHLEPNLAAVGIIILLTGWPLFRLGRKVFGGHSAHGAGTGPSKIASGPPRA